MITKMKAGVLGAFLSLVVFGTGGEAQANTGGYCREYTRTVYIGGMVQNAYGTACLQPDGSWMIVGEGLEHDIPDDVSNVNYVIHDNRREIIPPRVVYYNQPRVHYYRKRPAPVFVWYNNGHYRGKKFYGYHGKRHFDRHDRWDRDDRHRHGRGRDRD